MELSDIIIFAILAVFGLFVVGIFLLRSQARTMASNTAKEVFPVWAVQGPFLSGAESAAAMRNAYLAVLGTEETKKMAALIQQHEIAYDNDPEAWERTRRETAELADPHARVLAEGILAAERLNNDLLQSGGHRMEFTKLSDGNTEVLYNQIWSDEDIEKKKKEDGEAIVLGIGNGFLNDSSHEAQRLVEFLSDVYSANTGEEPDADAIGRTWLGFLQICDEDPESELVQEFERLNDAYSATKPPDREWSDNPGCFERHLQRKQNNPLFPDPDREVTQMQIEKARARDQEDAAKLHEKLVDMASDLESLPDLATGDDLSAIRERIDNLLDEAAGIGGQADDTRDSLNAIREKLIDSMRDGMKGNEEVLRALEEAQEYHHLRIKTVRDPFIAQLRRIPSSDVIPTMLSESPETIRKIMSMIGEDNAESVIEEAHDLMKRAHAEGTAIPLADEKLKAIRGEDR